MCYSTVALLALGQPLPEGFSHYLGKPRIALVRDSFELLILLLGDLHVQALETLDGLFLLRQARIVTLSFFSRSNSPHAQAP